MLGSQANRRHSLWNGSFKSVRRVVRVISLLVDARHRPRAAVRSRSGGGAARGSRPGLGCWGLGAAVFRAPAVPPVRRARPLGLWWSGCRGVKVSGARGLLQIEARGLDGLGWPYGAGIQQLYSVHIWLASNDSVRADRERTRSRSTHRGAFSMAFRFRKHASTRADVNIRASRQNIACGTRP